MWTPRQPRGKGQEWSRGVRAPGASSISSPAAQDLMTQPQLLNIHEYLPNSSHTPCLAFKAFPPPASVPASASRFLLTLFPVFGMLFLPFSPRSNTQTLVILQAPVYMHPSLMSLTADDISVSEFSQRLVHTSLRAYSITPPAVSIDCYLAQHLSSF